MNSYNPPPGGNGRQPPPPGFATPSTTAAPKPASLPSAAPTLEPTNPFQPQQQPPRPATPPAAPALAPRSPAPQQTAAPRPTPAPPLQPQAARPQSAPAPKPVAPPPQQSAPQKPPASAAPAQPSAPQSAAAAGPAANSRRPLTAPASLRLVPGANDPYPALQTDVNGAVHDSRRIAPRSARAALQPDDVPLPSRRSRRARHPFVIAGNLFLTLIFLLTIGAGVGFVVGKQRFELPGPLNEDKVVNVPRGGIRDTADLLVREGVIDQPYVFIAGALMLKTHNELKYGEYRFHKHASLRDIVDTIIGGKVVQHNFTLAEGLTSDQVVQKLLQNDVLTGDIREIPREGTLLPETYLFTRGTTREQIIQRMQQANRHALQEIWEHRVTDLPLRSPEQLVILASIVEKETGKPDERSRIAAVFINRLKQKMRLESDPTIIYGLVGGKGTLGRPIQVNEIRQPTPYNTYVIDGLPPGPIANPGRAALEAVANPARTKELFFVADGTGGHVFADTYDQHQKNVARLRALEQQAQPPAAAPAAPAPAAPPRRATRRSR